MDNEVLEDHESTGRVSYRSRNSGRSATVTNSSRRNNEGTPRSRRQYSSQVSDSDSNFHGSDMFPPDLDGNSRENDSSNTNFKNWLTSGILGALGAAAGATISTTGKLVAPPLEMTRTILLPGLLALIVDTLDTITPPRVQDWFRILSSSVYHLMVVLGSTERGKEFSTQLYVVLQDALHVLSAPESRQVLVDGMAASVKFADALHTPETKELLNQLGILSVRLADAASSGKTKLFFQDCINLTWQGIEMAADPATTLALAEVTAHLCHALDDAQQSLDPKARAHRNAQNQKVYLNPYQMADFPEQVSMEEVILSCLGLVDGEGDDAASFRSKMTIDDDFSAPEPAYRDWRERGEQVNVDLLKEKILKDKPTPSLVPNTTANSTTDGLGHSNEVGYNTSIDKLGMKTSEAEREREQSAAMEQDMEDIYLSKVPGGRKLKAPANPRFTREKTSSAVLAFYEKLDQFLGQNGAQLQPQAAAKSEKVIDNSHSVARGMEERCQIWEAKIKKLRHSRSHQPLESSSPFASNGTPRRSQIVILVTVIVFLFFSLLFSCFALYGAYSMLKTSLARQDIAKIPQQGLNTEKPLREEIVIRVIREVVHVREDGAVFEEAAEDDRRSQQGLNAVIDSIEVSLGEDGTVSDEPSNEYGLSSDELSAIMAEVEAVLR